jgi:tetratricopeptide (TPR) repeat protein
MVPSMERICRPVLAADSRLAVLVMRAVETERAVAPLPAFTAWGEVQKHAAQRALPGAVRTARKLGLALALLGRARVVRRIGAFSDARSAIAQARHAIGNGATASQIFVRADCDYEQGLLLLGGDQSAEARAALWQAIRGYASVEAKDRLAAATIQALRVELLAGTDPREAAGHGEAARNTLAAYGDRSGVADAEELIAEAMSRAGDVREASARLARAWVIHRLSGHLGRAEQCEGRLSMLTEHVPQDVIGGLGELPWLESTAEARAIGAELPLALGTQCRSRGDLEIAVRMFELAVTVAEASGNARARAEGRYQAGAALSAMNLSGSAVEALLDASQQFEGLADVQGVARCDYNLASEFAWNHRPAEADRHLNNAIEIFARLGQAGYLARCRSLRGLLLIEEGRYQEAIGEFEAAQARFAASGEQDPVASTDLGLAQAYRALGDATRAAQHIEAFRARQEALGNEAGLAFYETVLGEWSLDDRAATAAGLAAGIDSALRAIGRLEALRPRLGSAAAREAWMQIHRGKFGLATDLALRTGDAALVAELAESARAQAIPAEVDVAAISELSRVVAGRAAASAMSWLATPAGALIGLSDELTPQPRPAADARTAALLAFGAAPLAVPPPIAVAGRSRLRKSALPGDDGAAPVDLGVLLGDVGGPRAWWWGAGIKVGGPNEYLWTTVSPGGQAEAGVIPVADLAPLVEELLGSLPLPPGESGAASTMARVFAGPFCGDPQAEADLMGRLGEKLLPPPLLHALDSAREDPLPVLIAADSAFSRFPLALLGLPDGRRLVHVAVPRLMPSAVLSRVVADRLRREGTPDAHREIELLIANPGGDLPAAALLASSITARVTLEHAKATKDAVLTALPAGPARPGVLAYSGHVFSGFPGTSLTAALCLADSSPERPHGIPAGWLTARDLVVGEAARGMWDRVLLAGCSSAGNSAGSEWLGLAPALLWAGAASVIATIWDIPDHPRATTLDQELLTRLCADTDPAASVRAIQIQGLAEWTAQAGIDVSRMSASQLLAARACPLVFGAYAAVSMEQPAGQQPAT